MIDISAKESIIRIATASGRIFLKQETIEQEEFEALMGGKKDKVVKVDEVEKVEKVERAKKVAKVEKSSKSNKSS